MMQSGMNRPDKMEEECGVFGIFGVEGDAAADTYLGLFALQHRGQESAGIAVSDGSSIKLHKGMGLVSDVFKDEMIEQMHGTASVGHVRYSTTGGSNIANAQPLLIQCALGSVAIAHNGNIVNAAELRRDLILNGALFQGTTDSEVIANLIARSRKPNIAEALPEALDKVQGAFSLVVLAQDMIIGLRDRNGFRPLSIGKLGDGYVIASETCAIDSVGGEFIRDIEPGEMVIASAAGIESIRLWEAAESLCVFEYIYFARPDSMIAGHGVHQARVEFGRQLALECPVDADMVIPVPDSGISAALGFAQASGIPYGSGMIKNRYIGRTFIQPEQKDREKAVKIKLNPIASAIAGKRIVMVDDSIVRGTTSHKIVSMLREAGAKEVHLRVSSPPVKHSCFFGIDTPDREHLIGATHTIEEIGKAIEADSIGYLSIDGMLKVMKDSKLCLACFDGNYPVDVQGCMEGRCGCCGTLV